MSILHFGRYIIMRGFIIFFRGELRPRGIIIFADKWGPRHIIEFSKGGGFPILPPLRSAQGSILLQNKVACISLIVIQVIVINL